MRYLHRTHPNTHINVFRKKPAGRHLCDQLHRFFFRVGTEDATSQHCANATSPRVQRGHGGIEGGGGLDDLCTQIQFPTSLAHVTCGRSIIEACCAPRSKIGAAELARLQPDMQTWWMLFTSIL